MNKRIMGRSKKWVLTIILGCLLGHVNAQHTLSVKVNEPGAAIQPTMWGIFFEDINF